MEISWRGMRTEVSYAGSRDSNAFVSKAFVVEGFTVKILFCGILTGEKTESELFTWY